MERDEDVIEMIADDDPAEDTGGGSRTLTAGFVRVFITVCICIVAAAGAAGALAPKNEAAIESGLNSLKARDPDYTAAATDNRYETERRGSLMRELEEKKADLEEFKSSEDNISKIAEKNKALEEEKSALQKEVLSKQNALDSLEASSDSYTKRIVTLASGDYTVGKDIAAGDYTITGTGSIAVARNGKSIANKLLKADGEDFTLQADDRVHIDGTVKLIPR